MSIKKTTTYVNTISWTKEKFDSMLVEHSDDVVIKVYSKYGKALGSTTVGEVKAKNVETFTKGHERRRIIVANFNRDI